MLSQSQSLCLSDAIDLLTELIGSLKQTPTPTLSQSHSSRRNSSADSKGTSPTSPENWEAPLHPSHLAIEETESLTANILHIKSLLLKERERQQRTETDNLKINQQLASALSSTSLQVETLKKQLQQTKKECKAKESSSIADCNSSGSERENLNREIKMLSETKAQLEQEVGSLERRAYSIKDAGKRYDGLRQEDLKMNLGVTELELSKLREEMNLLRSERKKLRSDKQDLVSTLKQLYSALDEKESEISALMQSYDRRLAEKDELLSAAQREKRAVERERMELAAQSQEHVETSRQLREELERLQKQSNDAERTRRARSPTESSLGNKSLPPNGHLETRSVPHGSAVGSEETSNASEYAKPIKNFQHKATGVGTLYAKVNPAGKLSNQLKGGKETDVSPQYATVGPPPRLRNTSKYHSFTDNGITKSLDRDLNRQTSGGSPQSRSPYASFRMPERRSSSTQLKGSLSFDNVSPPLPIRNQGQPSMEEDRAESREQAVLRLRSKSINSNGQDKTKNNSNNANIFVNSLSRIFSRNKRRKPVNTDRTSQIPAPIYSNLPPQHHKLPLTNSIEFRHKREAPPPPTPVASSPKLQTSHSSLTKAIFGSEERKIGLLEETRKVHISRWNQITVLAWMEVRLGMAKYLQSALHVIQSGQTLLELTESEYETELGILNPVHKRKLSLAIEDSRRPQNNPHPTIHEMDHYWVAQVWLPKLGLSRYSKLFHSNLVDGRILRSLQKREADQLLKIASRNDQLSLNSGIQLLRHLNFSKDMWQECLNTEPVYWDNERVYTWLQSIDLMEFADQVLRSGVHGALLCLEQSFTHESLALIMNIPHEDTEHRKRLRRQLESLTNTFQGFRSPSREGVLTRSFSIPRGSTTPRSYVADKTTPNSYNRGFTMDANSISRNLSNSFNSSTHSLLRKRVESTPV